MYYEQRRIGRRCDRERMTSGEKMGWLKIPFKNNVMVVEIIEKLKL